MNVSEHNSLNSSKGIIRDRMLRGEPEDSIVEYLRPQGVTGCKRFKIKKDGKNSRNKYFTLDFQPSKCTKITENFLSCRSG